MKYWLNLIVLHYLTKGPTYGYRIRKEARQASGGRIVGNGIETALTRMCQSGLVSRENRVQNGHLVAYYTITPTGILQYQVLRTSWDEACKGVTEILNQ